MKTRVVRKGLRAACVALCLAVFSGRAAAASLETWQKTSDHEIRQVLHTMEVLAGTVGEMEGEAPEKMAVLIRLQCSLEALLEDHDFFSGASAHPAVKALVERGVTPDFEAWRRARAAWWEQERVIRPWLARLDVLTPVGAEEPDLALTPFPGNPDLEPDVPALEARMEALMAGKGRSTDPRGEYVNLARRVSEARSRVGREMLLLFVRARVRRLPEEERGKMDLEVLGKALERQDRAGAETDAWMAGVEWKARHP